MNTYYIPQWFSFKIAKVNCNIWIKKKPNFLLTFYHRTKALQIFIELTYQAFENKMCNYSGITKLTLSIAPLTENDMCN